MNRSLKIDVYKRQADVIATLPDTDWQKLALRNNAIQQRHALSFSGIKNGVNYYTALGILDQGSLFKEGHNDKYTRYNLRSNVSTTFDPIGLEVGLNIDGAWAVSYTHLACLIKSVSGKI